jgi:hypothetical protein
LLQDRQGFPVAVGWARRTGVRVPVNPGDLHLPALDLQVHRPPVALALDDEPDAIPSTSDDRKLSGNQS